jgi:hypothetical protein
VNLLVFKDEILMPEETSEGTEIIASSEIFFSLQ